jgi:hypothetical protein
MVKKDQVLITEEGYEGKYVALRSIVDRTVVASGYNPKVVMKEAHQKGCAEPLIFYVPEHTISYCQGSVLSQVR